MNKENPPFFLSWSTKTPNIVLIVFLTLILPGIRFGFGSHHWAALYVLDSYMVLVMIALLPIRKISLRNLGVSSENLRQNLISGFSIGGLILIGLPTLDFLIDTTGLSKMELFSKSNSISYEESSLISIAIWFIHVILDQLFFLGFIAQTWLKRYNPWLAIYIFGIIFALAHTKLTVGFFLIGLISCLLFHLTKTLVASTIFQLACLTAGLLLEKTYPRLVTLLGFLF